MELSECLVRRRARGRCSLASRLRTRAEYAAYSARVGRGAVVSPAEGEREGEEKREALPDEVDWEVKEGEGESDREELLMMLK